MLKDIQRPLRYQASAAKWILSLLSSRIYEIDSYRRTWWCCQRNSLQSNANSWKKIMTKCGYISLYSSIQAILYFFALCMHLISKSIWKNIFHLITILVIWNNINNRKTIQIKSDGKWVYKSCLYTGLSMVEERNIFWMESWHTLCVVHYIEKRWLGGSTYNHAITTTLAHFEVVYYLHT